MKAIMAVNKLGYIGKDNKMLWYNKNDLKHFKTCVYETKCLVGSTTFENMPKINWIDFIVVGKKYNTLETALNQKPTWCIGGANLLQSVIPLITELHLSIIDNYEIGDTMLPNISEIKNIINYYF
jgi:dihydrofolate reductase